MPHSFKCNFSNSYFDHHLSEALMCIQNLVKFCAFILKILSKNQFLTSIKGRNSVANLRKMMLYNPNVDLVNDNVHAKFGLILSNHSQDIEQKPISGIK